jgi:hypothetical protein
MMANEMHAHIVIGLLAEGGAGLADNGILSLLYAAVVKANGARVDAEAMGAAQSIEYFGAVEERLGRHAGEGGALAAQHLAFEDGDALAYLAGAVPAAAAGGAGADDDQVEVPVRSHMPS